MPGETIARAAIRTTEGTVYSLWRPRRHEDLIIFLRQQGLPIPPIQNHGFVTSTGRFVSSTEAARVALAAGQIPRTHPHLQTEHLW